MARARVLGGAALLLLGVATADAVLSSTVTGKVRRRSLHQDEPLFHNVRRHLVGASQALLSAVLLRAPPLSGERLRAAERGVARALQEQDGAGAADLRLLLALLAARDGRFDEALRLYGEAARDDPSDPRPRMLGHALCRLTGRPVVGSLRWERDRAAAAEEDRAQLLVLLEELVIAAALGGAPLAFVAGEGGSLAFLLRFAARRADAGLAAAAAARRDGGMPAAKRLQLHALRVFFQVSVASALKTAASDGVPEADVSSKKGERDGKEAA